MLQFWFYVSRTGCLSPQTRWQKTSVCLSSSSAIRCPGTLPVRRSGPQMGGTIWYQLLSGGGAGPKAPSLLSSVKVTNDGQAKPGRRRRDQWWIVKDLVTLRWTVVPPPHRAAGCLQDGRMKILNTRLPGGGNTLCMRRSLYSRGAQNVSLRGPQLKWFWGPQAKCNNMIHEMQRLLK